MYLYSDGHKNIADQFIRKYYFICDNIEFDYVGRFHDVVSDLRHWYDTRSPGLVYDDHDWIPDLWAFAMHFNLTCSRKRTFYHGLFNYWIGRPECITVPIPCGIEAA